MTLYDVFVLVTANSQQSIRTHEIQGVYKLDVPRTFYLIVLYSVAKLKDAAPPAIDGSPP